MKSTEIFKDVIDTKNGILRIPPPASNGLGASKFSLNQSDSHVPEVLTLHEEESLSKEVKYDLLDVSACLKEVSDESNNISFTATVSLTEKTPSLKLWVYVFDKKKHKLLGECTECFDEQNVDKAYWRGNIDVLGASQEELQNAFIIAKANWQKPYPVEIYKANPINITNIDFEYEHFYPKQETKTVVLGNPPDKETKERIEAGSPYAIRKDSQHIVVSLWRMPEDQSDVDYMCYFGRVNNDNNKPPYFGIPGKGRIRVPAGIRLKENNYFKAICYAQACDEKGNIAGGGVFHIARTHETKDGDIEYNKSSDNVIDYQFTSAWNGGKDTFDEEGGFRKTYFSYHLDIEIYDEDGSIYSGRVGTDVSLATASEYSFSWPVDPIAVMYGCILGGTKVLMADNQEKPIEQIRIGDIVFNPVTGRNSKVVNTWAGIEDIMYKISTKDGSSIIVSGFHPMVTSKGVVPAMNLGAKRYLITTDGNQKEIMMLTRIGEVIQKIYNLDLDDGSGKPQYFSAGGFRVGTNQMQNEMMEGIWPAL
jgi:hypothetical protein